MLHYSRAFAGLQAYLLEDLLPQRKGSPVSLLGGAAVRYLAAKADKVYTQLRAIPALAQEMATAHLGFNNSGRKILSLHLDAMGNDPTAIGKREAYTAWLNSIDAEASAVQAQIDIFNR